jgi:DNA-binding NtrC family response regulator
MKQIMTAVHALLLVVDDDETNREILSHRLERQGYRVATAEDGAQALEAVRRQRFDLVLLDIMMPEVNGLEVLRTLRRSYSLTELPVIMASALDQSADVVQALELGANDYVTKPFDLPVVLARVATQLCLKRAVEQVRYLQEEIQCEYNFEEIIGVSIVLRDLLDKVKRVAPTHSTVLIMGESGTGKELIARAIHNLSPRRAQPLVKVNCGAISAGLVESELFGHEKGAFTGAQERRLGRFELADGGTIFLDEVGDLPLDTQVKLLRVLQDQEFERVGSSHPLKIDVRVIAATNRNLAEAVKQRSFRDDLYYRLHVVPLVVPPLRDRREDIPALVQHFLAKFSRRLGKQFEGVREETMRQWTAYCWPGNVRELQNVVERAAVLSNGPTLDDCFAPATEEDGSRLPPRTLEDAERLHILRVLKQTRGIIEGKEGAATILGLRPSTLRSRMRKLGIKRPDSSPRPE